MKNYKINSKAITLCLVLLAYCGIASAQDWQKHWQSVSAQEKIKFLDDSTGYMSANSSDDQNSKGAILLKTTNGGIDWQPFKFAGALFIQAFDFLPSGHGFMCVRSSTAITYLLYHTTDGGASWSISPLPSNYEFYNIEMVSSQLIYATGNGFLYKSTNAGVSWNLTQMSVSNPQFFNADLGYVLGQHSVRKTTNGGQSWQQIPTGVSIAANSRPFRTMHFLNENQGFVAGDSGRVWRTTNAGTTWVRQSVGDKIRLVSMGFADSNHGYMAGNKFTGFDFKAVLFHTSNGGVSWQQQFEEGGYFNQLSVAGNAVYACGYGGTVVKTTNQGTEWKTITSYYGYSEDIHFPSSRTGYILAANYNGTYLNKTTSFGQIWNAKPVNQLIQTKLQTVFFTDSLTGYLAGQRGTITKTTDGGETWEPQRAGFPDTIRRLHFTSGSTGYALGGVAGAGLLLRTTNAGASWLPQTLPVATKQLRDIWFVNPNTAYIVGDAGLILKTTNTGANWTISSSGSLANLSSIWFVNTSTGLAAGQNGAVIRTTNSGNSWNTQVLYPNGAINDVKCIQNICYAVGRTSLTDDYNALVYTSTDMGNTWTLTLVGDPLYAEYGAGKRIYFRNESVAYILTDSFWFWEYNAVGTSVFKPKNPKPTLTFDLYPNPSQDGHFTVSHKYTGKTQVSITTSQGKQMLKTQTDKAQIQIKLPSGLYFVRLANGQGSSVQKVVVR